MSMNIEEEFNSFFKGDDSLYNKLGEDKAKKVLDMLKNMIKGDAEGNIEGFIIANPFDLKNITTTSKDSEKEYPEISFDDFFNMGEPDTIEEGFDKGHHFVKKTWLDENGDVIGQEITYSEDPDNEDEIPNPFGEDGMLSGMFSLPFFNYKKQPSRTLEELLEIVVEQEEYEVAARIRDNIAKKKEFEDTIWKELAEANEARDILTVKKLTKLLEENILKHQQLIDEIDDFLRD